METILYKIILIIGWLLVCFGIVVFINVIYNPSLMKYRIVEVKNNRTNETKYRTERSYKILALKFIWFEVNSFSSLEEAEKEYLFLCSSLPAEEETIIKQSDKNRLL